MGRPGGGPVELGVRRGGAVLHQRRGVRGHAGATTRPRPESLVPHSCSSVSWWAVAGPRPRRALRRPARPARRRAGPAPRTPARTAPRARRRPARTTAPPGQLGRAQVGPPVEHRRTEVLEHVLEAAGPAREVLRRDRTEQRPAQAGAGGDGAVEIGDRDHAAADQVVGLAPQRGLEPVDHVPGELGAHVHGLAPPGAHHGHGRLDGVGEVCSPPTTSTRGTSAAG